MKKQNTVKLLNDLLELVNYLMACFLLIVSIFTIGVVFSLLLELNFKLA